MYGALFFIPIYAQGVIGTSVTNSGAMLVPLMFSAVALSVLVGRLITRTGRYKEFVLAGLIVMGAGYYLLTRLGYGSTQTDLTVVMVGLGLGLAAALHSVFLVGLVIIGIALVTRIFIKELPLRDTAFADEDVGKQVLDEPNRSAANGAYASDRRDVRQKP